MSIDTSTTEYTFACERLLPCKKASVAQQQEKPLEYALTKKFYLVS